MATNLRIEDFDPEEIAVYMSRLFAMGDANGDGVLEPDEFRRLLELSGFRFTANDIEKLFNAADTNADGVIEYEEFIPTMLYLLLDEAWSPLSPQRQRHIQDDHHRYSAVLTHMRAPQCHCQLAPNGLGCPQLALCVVAGRRRGR